MLIGIPSAPAHEAAERLPKELSPFPKEALRIYGPVTASQCDHAGVPIQRYLTVLVECRGNAWQLRRTVTNLSGASGTAPRLVEMNVSADDARRWLTQNQSVSESRA